MFFDDSSAVLSAEIYSIIIIIIVVVFIIIIIIFIIINTSSPLHLIFHSLCVWSNQVRNEVVQRRISVMGELAGRAECVEVVWTSGENGGGLVGEKNRRIRCVRLKGRSRTRWMDDVKEH